MTDLVAVVYEPAPAEPPPAEFPGSGAVTALEGSAPGSSSTRRWLIAEPDKPGGAESVLAALAAAASEPPQVSLVARKLGEERSPRWRPEEVTYVMPVPIAAPPTHVEELDRWYDEEHTPMLLRCPAWLRVRRYAVETISGASWTRLALHDLDAADVLTHPEVQEALATPWRWRLAGEPWFLTEGRPALAVRR